jgi:SAM-dependent methyltransferase
MNRPPGPFARGRRKLLELLAPGLEYSLKRRYWNHAWAEPDWPSRRNFWFLPDGLIPREIRTAVQDGWFRPGGKALDIGCGDGRIAHYLATSGFNVLGVDFAAPAIDRARSRFGESETLRFRVIDICEEVPEPGPFDAIVDRGCYHGLPNRLRPAYLQTLSACSRAGTRLLLMVKVTMDMDVGSEQRALLSARTLEEVTARFNPQFALERAEPVWFNSRGDDDGAQSLPGLVLRLTRRDH